MLIYLLIFRPLLKGGIRYKRLSAASVTSVVIGLELGAFCVVLQTLLSGITQLPFGTFAAFMLPVHLVIGLIEGAVTAAVLCFVYKMRPEVIVSAQSREYIGGASMKKVFLIFAVSALVAGGVLSLFASADPDGLEWAIGNTTRQALGAETELEARGGVFDGAAGVQETTAILPDYAFAADPENAAGTSVSGIAGVTVTFALACAAGLIISKVKKIKRARENA